jgi:hypothetical protein
MTLEDLRSRADVDPQTGCWRWTGSKNSLGYGTVRFEGRTQYVHRVALRLSGREPTKSTDHLCRVRCCFNPAHLESVTQRENLRRAPSSVAAMHAAKTHCKHGHPFDTENTIILNAKGWRDCRACRRARRNRSRR